MKDIAEKFFNKFSLQWFKTEWDGEITLFDEFDKDIESALEDPVKKFWNGLV
ncbi:unnamed protein product [marine sediment metagenome]|uniref:Uncharacterized protein n=1 Tax=marine sediment metagenome TaxID=412755 RepID=X1A979_9ZZZZ